MSVYIFVMDRIQHFIVKCTRSWYFAGLSSPTNL